MIKKIVYLLGLVMLLIICCNSKVFAANVYISAPQSVYVGDTITVKVMGNAASWSGLNLKASGPVSGSGGLMANVTESGENENVTMGTFSFKATAIGTAKFYISSGTLVNSDYTKNPINSEISKMVQIKEKPKEEPKTNTTTTNTKTNTTTQKKVENKTTKKTTTTNKNTQQNNVKKNEDIVVNKEDQGTKEELLIEDMNVFAVDKDGNKEEIKLTPEFDGKVIEYTLNVENNIDKLEFDSKYNKEYELKIEGLEEDLKVGENIVKLTITRDEESKVYTFKVIKEEEKIAEENEKNVEKEENKEKDNQKKLSFSVLEFIGIIIGCILLENIIVLSVYKIIKDKKQENY